MVSLLAMSSMQDLLAQETLLFVSSTGSCSTVHYLRLCKHASVWWGNNTHMRYPNGLLTARMCTCAGLSFASNPKAQAILELLASRTVVQHPIVLFLTDGTLYHRLRLTPRVLYVARDLELRSALCSMCQSLKAVRLTTLAAAVYMCQQQGSRRGWPLAYFGTRLAFAAPVVSLVVPHSDMDEDAHLYAQG